MSTLYAGPGKVYMSAKALWPEGENGEIKAEVKQQAVDLASGFFGRVTALQGDAQAIISLTPFDNWSALPLLFPAYLGVSVGATTGALVIGTRPHNVAGGSDVPAEIWTPDGRSYSFPRAAVTKHPDLHLAINKPLFGPVEIACLIATGSSLGGSGSLYTIVESAAADPGGQQSGTDYQRGAWYRGVGRQTPASAAAVETRPSRHKTSGRSQPPRSILRCRSSNSCGLTSSTASPSWPRCGLMGRPTHRSMPPSA